MCRACAVSLRRLEAVASGQRPALGGCPPHASSGNGKPWAAGGAPAAGLPREDVRQDPSEMSGPGPGTKGHGAERGTSTAPARMCGLRFRAWGSSYLHAGTKRMLPSVRWQVSNEELFAMKRDGRRNGSREHSSSDPQVPTVSSRRHRARSECSRGTSSAWTELAPSTSRASVNAVPATRISSNHSGDN